MVVRQDLREQLESFELVLQEQTVAFEDSQIALSYLVVGTDDDTAIVVVVHGKPANIASSSEAGVSRLEWSFTIPSNLVVRWTATRIALDATAR